MLSNVTDKCDVNAATHSSEAQCAGVFRAASVATLKLIETMHQKNPANKPNELVSLYHDAPQETALLGEFDCCLCSITVLLFYLEACAQIVVYCFEHPFQMSFAPMKFTK